MDRSETPPGRSREEMLACLRGARVFADLDDSSLSELAALLELEAVASGETLFEQGDRAEALYVVLGGELEALLRREDGNELVLSRMGPGETVGEIQVLTAGARTATVRATADSELARLPRSAVEQLGESHPQILARIADVIRERLRRDQLVTILPGFLGELDEATLTDVETMIDWIHLARGECLFKQGDAGDSLCLVVSGRLNVVITTPDGKELVVGEIAGGESVGEMAVFTGEPRTASVYAVRDSELAVVSKANFERIVQHHPQLLTAVTKMLVERLRERSGPAESGDTVLNVAIVPLGHGVPLPEFAERLATALEVQGKTIHLSSRRLDNLLEMKGAAQLPEDSPFNIRISAWLDQLEAKHRFVVFEADPGNSPWTRRCIRQADQVLLVGQASGDPAPSEIETDLLNRESPLTAARRRLILIHPDGSRLPTGTRHWLEGRSVEMHHHVRWDTPGDFERIARFLAGRAMGLVLGGGGARGMAHIGVIRALIEGDVPIDIVGGTSAGAVVSTQHAMGSSPDKIHRATRKAFLDNKPFREFTIPIVSLVAANRLNRMSQEMYGDVRLEDLWLNCFCVSCNLSTSETVVHRSGIVWRAVRASSALPGIVVPIIDSNKLLVDGGIVDNLPGQIMKELSRGPLILVDVSPDEDLKVEHDEMPSARKILWSWIMPHRKSIRVPTIMDMIVRTSVISSVKRREEAKGEAVLFFKPPVNDFGLLEFASFDKIVDAGYRYAVEQIAGWPERAEHTGEYKRPGAATT